MIRAIWKALKPTDLKHYLMYLGAILSIVILAPDIKNAYQNEGHLTQSQVIDLEMTKRWMILPQDQTKAGTLTSPKGTKFIFRVYPDDSLLVSDGKRLKWLPSEAALAEIESKRPSHRWILDLIPFLGSINFIGTAHAQAICKDGPKQQISATVFVWRRWCQDRFGNWVPFICKYNARTGQLHCQRV